LNYDMSYNISHKYGLRLGAAVRQAASLQGRPGKRDGLEPGGRMKLTCRSEYALLALIYLARHQEEEYISVQTICAAQQIPCKFLEQILLTLRRAKFVRSSKGKSGGFRLAKTPDKISLAEILRHFDGALAPTESVSENFYEKTPIEKEPKLLAVFKDVRDYISDKMEGTMLADVC